ncbi:MAG: hypothetical protein FGM33_07950 [Candidatus Kapabacteria bacterium]|nr:hypothetical protein [Candidatus Kapabacteria bacterium]
MRAWRSLDRGRTFAAIAALLVGGVAVSAQQLAPLLPRADSMSARGIDFGVDKITNTFVWTGNADVNVATPFGALSFVNRFRSTAFRTSTLATRDDQQSQIGFSVPLGATLSAVVRQAWMLSQDSRSIGLNSLERLGAAAGLRYSAMPGVDLEGIAGAESSSQLGVNAAGPLAAFVGTVRGLDLDQWAINGGVTADWQRLDERRTNSDVDLTARIERDISEGSLMSLSVRSTDRRRQFFTSVSSAAPLNVEQRHEQLLDIGASINYAVTPTFAVGFDGIVQSNGIERSFGSPVSALPLTSVSRRLDELVVDVSGSLQWTLQKLRASVTGSVFRRSERNGVQDVHGVAASDLQAARAQEFQRDNEAFRTRGLVRLEWTPTSIDTVRVDGASWLLRYDTPSATNDDDRDELASTLTLSYGRRISDGLSMNLALSGQFLHLVFLKSSRSALNNINRSLRLAPSLHLRYSILTMQPQFEILANYTAYDYETAAASARSFSFRQMSYRDSVRVRLTERLALEVPVLFRYFERATFRWATFSESPETGNIEYLIKLLVTARPSDRFEAGAGLRLYRLDQSSIRFGQPSISTGSLHSIGPEVVLRYASVGGSSVSLSGWYEFQTINITAQRQLPNILLRCFIAPW